MSARGTWTRPSLEERAMSRFEITDNGCWSWQGTINAQGYGMILPNGDDHPLRAHRVVYEHVIGPIPEGLTLDHTCHNEDLACPGGSDCLHRRCVNPAHLEPVTIAENVRRGAARKTHCVAGHAYDEANTIIRPGKGRECRACISAQKKAAYRAANGEVQLPNGERTHCPQGHAYDETNTHINRRGHRQCRACNRIRMRGAKARAMGATSSTL